MYVTVWNRRIPVNVASDVRDKDDNPCYGLFIAPFGPIVLDSSTPHDDRRRVLVHEIGEAVSHFVGDVAAGDTEGHNNRTSTIEETFAADLNAQGGIDVVHSLFGDNAAPSIKGKNSELTYMPHYQDTADSPTKIACGHCHKEHYSAMAVTNSTPAFDPAVNNYVMNRTLVCGKCERQTLWVEACTADGTPLGLVIGKPRVHDTRKPAMA